jgi:hypothetical protein
MPKLDGWKSHDKVGTECLPQLLRNGPRKVIALLLHSKCSRSSRLLRRTTPTCARKPDGDVHRGIARHRVRRGWRLQASKQITRSFVTMRDEHLDLESTVKPRLARALSPNKLLGMFMPRHPATGSATAARQLSVAWSSSEFIVVRHWRQ